MQVHDQCKATSSLVIFEKNLCILIPRNMKSASYAVHYSRTICKVNPTTNELCFASEGKIHFYMEDLPSPLYGILRFVQHFL
mmetsp:Transcript_31996/g.61241  ORF Transcript_31996/g.61241 Transcript_31996/m.61241 type:complete len:82 (-) Transcript_31996:51-296(-)